MIRIIYQHNKSFQTRTNVIRRKHRDDVIKWIFFRGDRWIPLTKATDVELWCFFVLHPNTVGWANNRGIDDLRRHRAHYDVTAVHCPAHRSRRLFPDLFLIWMDRTWQHHVSNETPTPCFSPKLNILSAHKSLYIYIYMQLRCFGY